MTRPQSISTDRSHKNNPSQYPKGPVNFCGCPIDLSRKPFIPSPETEWWVRQAAGIINKQRHKVRILDMFAGSGCMGIALYKLCPGKVEYIAFGEKYSSACSQIRTNCELNRIPKSKYKIFQSDVFKNIKGRYDYICAHPPYVSTPWFLSHKPVALSVMPKGYFLGGENGFFYIKKFLKSARNFLSGQGVIFMGHDRLPTNKKKVEEILLAAGYTNYVFHRIFCKEVWGAYGWVEIRI